MVPLVSTMATFQPSGSLSESSGISSECGVARDAQHQRRELAGEHREQHVERPWRPRRAPITRPETTTSLVSSAFWALGMSLLSTGGAPKSLRVDRIE